MRLEGAAALVTGGASGLGLATVRALVTAGARVVAVDLPGAEAAARVADAGAEFAEGDVTDEHALSAALDLAEGLGSLRIAVACAGIAPPAKLLGRDGPLPLDRIDRVLRVDLLGTLNLARLAAERIARTDPVDGERGVLVTTASVAAFDGQIGQVAYAAAKAGVAGATLPMARELAAHLIRVVSIAPGIFDTPLLAALPEAARESLGAQVPHPSRLGRPEEFAALVLHVVDNPMLNGEVIRLDGGIRMAPR
ncbi:NAD(P)-dependent dehydrogenase (short-subunit alcohol dehydrogenase family) [Diaminobutyricimonas aerilata]|uniref:NAD(P)-dependent dehydrogenase (Short-subunit alcohol dehydrogenase family) n=1 Tax=Diaminobutyricimonas aerilata TaxID=1162967 RepID=A0A2M9CLR4_9MICO|nr:SDR family NAD(P)-dependent oxidoreductase [Diaminobutyricimonas aerilata]PJJ72847.1 NAD(P)-dependent dehydrogenase (short-subunit alcohol dehydrogenase family) [Diaminobutyricimonas aerilata]